MNLLRIALLLVLAQAAPPPQAPATASVEGIVVRLGTSDPIAGADVELSRVEGTKAAPLPPNAAEAYARTLPLVGGGNNSQLLPLPLVSEVQYTKTGADGKFSFKQVKEGKYRLVSVRIGGMYQPGEYGQRDPQGRGFNFPLAQGQVFKDAKLEMAPTGAITGRVTDENGRPVGHARVSALAPRIENGRRFLTVFAAVHTDDNGNFRLFWLTPGRYYLAARYEDMNRRTITFTTVPPGRLTTNEVATSPIVARHRLASGEIEEETTALVYYGGVLDPDRAKPLEVLAGETFAAADIPLGVGKMRSWHIRGTLLDSTGQPAKNANVRAIPRQWSPNALVLTSSTEANGNFDLLGAVPGSYALFATTTAPAYLTNAQAAVYAAAGVDPTRAVAGIPTETGYVPVDVGNADVGGIKITTTRGINVSGRVVIEGRPPSDNDPDLPKILVQLRRDPDIVYMPAPMIPLPLEPSPGGGSPTRPDNGKVTKEGKFNILAGLGDFQVEVSGIPANSYVKSIRMGNVDILTNGLQVNAVPDSPMEVVIGTDGGEVTGNVTNDRSEIMTNVVVAVVPESPLLRRRYDLYRSGATDFMGKFRLQNIPPGTYKLFSWEYVDSNAWQDAQFLQPYETVGKLLTIREGSTQEVPLKVTPLRR